MAGRLGLGLLRATRSSHKNNVHMAVARGYNEFPCDQHVKLLFASMHVTMTYNDVFLGSKCEDDRQKLAQNQLNLSGVFEKPLSIGYLFLILCCDWIK